MNEDSRQYAFVGKPDGPPTFVAAMGTKVGTFTERHAELEPRLGPGKNSPCIMWHVPREFRGPYHPEDRADYSKKLDDEGAYPRTYDGWANCEGKLKAQEGAKTDRAGEPCKRKAVHRSGFCQVHGGKLHPLDMPAPVTRDPSTMNRRELLKFGYITVDDLDDEELIHGMARDKRGKFPGKNASDKATIPKPIYDKMVQRLFDRAQEKLRENVLAAIDTLAEISQGDAFEASDRANASKFIVERVLGKTTEKVDLTVTAKPFEQILSGIAPMTREESRAQRALETAARQEIIEGEVVEWEADSSEQSTSAWTEDAPGTEQESVSDEPKLSSEELKDKVQTARNRRYAARAQGNTSVRNLAYQSERIGNRIQWTHPDEVKVPTSVKAQETRERNYRRKRGE